MVVDHSCGLHVGVADRRADKFETSLFEVFAEGIRFLRCRRVILQAPNCVHDRFAIDKSPDIGAETAELVGNL